MPPKTKKAASTEPSTDDKQNGGVGEICEESAVTTAMADMTMFSTQNVQNIIETLQRSQTEALKELLQSVSSRTTSCTAQGQGTLTGCKTTFSGQPQESVEAFIDAVDAYSECAQVSDTNVLRGLAYLLKENAATWWQGVKQQITSWQQAKENLISAYGDRRPPHRIYIEIFSSPQQTENTDVFVARIRSLFARLPEGDISEKAQLDMTYGLLSSRIRKRLRREDVASFKELLRRARSVEDSFDEGERKQTPPQAANRAVTSNQRAPPASTTTACTGTSHASGAPAATAPQSSALAQPRTPPTPTQPAVAQGPGTGITTTVADASVKKQRPVCAYCRRFGHSKDQCRKLMNSGESTSNNNTANSANVRPISETSDISFYSVDFNSCNVDSKNRTQNTYFSMGDTCSNLSLIPHSNKVENGTTHHCYEYDVPRSNMIPACTTTATTGEKCLHSFVPKAVKNITCATNSLQTTNPHSCNEQFRCRGPLSSITVPTCSSNYSVISSEDARKCSMTDSREQNELYLTNGRNSILCVNNNNRPCNNNEYSPFASKCINPSNSGDVTEVDTFFGADCGKISDDELIYLYMTYVDGDCETVGRTTRPIFNIEILGVKGTGLVDTGAKRCVAGHTLYAILLRRNHLLRTITRNIKLADGVSRAMEVLVTILEVRLEQEIVKIPFLIFPYATNNETLLGIDFLTAAGVDIDFLELVWCFSRNRTVQYKLCFEPTSPSVTCATTNVLRDDEGSHLTPAERQALAGVLTRHAHVFTPGGAPTPYAEHRIETGEHPPIAVQNVVADTLSRPVCSGDSREDCGVCSVVVDLPTKNPAELRREQLADPEVERIVKEVEGSNEVASRRWTERGYLMEQGVLYRYNPDSDSETPQLVIPISLRAEILKECHDSPVAGHPGVDRTYQKIAQLYYFTGMRRIITDYVKACIHCQRYKAINTKPPGLLQTPLMNQRNEVLAMDLFGPLPLGDQGERWIFLVEDTATRWTELYALKDATAEACAVILVEEYFMRFGLPRRVISDNGVQFISAVMRQCMAALGIKQNLAPLYHPEANPAERKNRDMKPMLAQLVEEDHTSWPRKLPVIRFALNSARCRTTGKSPAYLTFGREMRSPTEVIHDLRAILGKDNFVPQITPYLQSFLNSLSGIRERVEIQQDKAKEYADASRRPSEEFEVGDLVLLKSHLLSNTFKDVTAKFLPRRDGPYVITEKVSPTTYTIASTDQPDISLGRYHTQDLTRYRGNDGDTPRPVVPKRNRGRPPNTDRNDRVLVQERGRSPGLEGEHIANRVDDTNGQTSTAFKLPARASRGQLPARYTE
ncbi:uncharacterized protein LOC133528471 [Cydia pomonella]|uniref:uncharacterized protein LOC133528471 n=1 Tax=Cydia pomonella TaxID=82600 RepID=UPI002ADD870F|nr:uncharacterized protein LOC133528471 [Cydia pomonella]